MRYIIFILVILHAPKSYTQKSFYRKDLSSDTCGIIDLESLFDYDFDVRVVGGDDIVVKQSPWSVILENKSEQNKEKIVVFCGGTLISQKHITTAAHCLWGNTHGGRICPERFRHMKTAGDCHNRRGGCPTGCRRIRAQDLNLYLGVTSVTKQDRRRHTVEAIHYPELWDKSSISTRENAFLGHDIAILQLAETQQFSDKIKSICLPLHNFMELRNATIDGYGSITPGLPRKPADRLQRGLLQLMAKEACDSKWGFLIKGDQFCAGSNGADSCKGDSGTGLHTVVNGGDDEPEINVLIGITSLGPIYCGHGSFPGLYTNVISHMDWIEERISYEKKRNASEDVFGLEYYDYDYDYDVRVEESTCLPNASNNIGRVLLVGGFVGVAKQSNQVFLQDCHYSSFEDIKIPLFPINISLAAGQILGDTVFICGGFNGKFQSRSNCFTFTFQNGEVWKEGPHLITPRANAAMVSSKAGLWITGGRNGPINFLDSTELFNKSTSMWVNGPTLNRKLGLHCALTHETSTSDRVIIIGGAWYDDKLEDYMRTDIVESFDLSTGESTSLPSLNTARSSHSCVLLPGSVERESIIIVAGGKMSSRERLDSVEYFKTGTSRWIYKTSLPYAVSGATFVLQNTLPLLIGGLSDLIIDLRSDQSNPSPINSFSDSVYAYNISTDSWSNVGRVDETVAFHTAVTIPDQLCQPKEGEDEDILEKWIEWFDIRHAN